MAVKDDYVCPKRLAQAERLRRMAFFGVAMSTIAALICVLCVPVIYNYLQHVQSLLQNEVDYCKASPFICRRNGGFRLGRIRSGNKSRRPSTPREPKHVLLVKAATKVCR